MKGVLEKCSGEQRVDAVTGLVPIILLVGAAVGWRDSRRDSNMKHKTNQSRTPAAPHNTGPDAGRSAVKLLGSQLFCQNLRNGFALDLTFGQ